MRLKKVKGGKQVTMFCTPVELELMRQGAVAPHGLVQGGHRVTEGRGLPARANGGVLRPCGLRKIPDAPPHRAGPRGPHGQTVPMDDGSDRGLTVLGCMEFRIEQENRLRETGCILAEWDRRLPLMTREAREIHAKESPKPAPRNSHGQFTEREGGAR